jgi:hypothetical protein
MKLGEATCEDVNTYARALTNDLELVALPKGIYKTKDEIKMQKLSGDQLGAFVQVSPIAFYQAGMQPADLRRWFEEVKLFIMLQPLSFKRSQLNALQEQITRAKKSFVDSFDLQKLKANGNRLYSFNYVNFITYDYIPQQIEFLGPLHLQSTYVNEISNKILRNAASSTNQRAEDRQMLIMLHQKAHVDKLGVSEYLGPTVAYHVPDYTPTAPTKTGEPMKVLTSATLIKYIRDFPKYEAAKILGNKKFSCKGLYFNGHILRPKFWLIVRISGNEQIVSVLDFFTLSVVAEETMTEIVIAYVKSVKPIAQLPVPGCDRLIDSFNRYLWLGSGPDQVQIIRRIQVITDGASVVGKTSYLYNKNIM